MRKLAEGVQVVGIENGGVKICNVLGKPPDGGVVEPDLAAFFGNLDTGPVGGAGFQDSGLNLCNESRCPRK